MNIWIGECIGICMAYVCMPVRLAPIGVFRAALSVELPEIAAADRYMSTHMYAHMSTHMSRHLSQNAREHISEHAGLKNWMQPEFDAAGTQQFEAACLHTCQHTCVHTCPYACLHTCPYTCLHTVLHTGRRYVRVWRRLRAAGRSGRMGRSQVAGAAP